MLNLKYKNILLLSFVILFSMAQAQAKGQLNSYHVKEIQLDVINAPREEKDIKYIKEKYLGKNLSHVELMAVNEDLVKYFWQEDGYIASQITINEQDLKTSGTLKIIVEPGVLRDVVLFNDTPDNKLIDEYINKIISQKPITNKHIQKYISLMNRIPGYYVDYEFRKTDNKSTFDLVLKVSKLKGEIYTSIDSYGSTETGQMENSVFGKLYSKDGGSDAISFSGFTSNYPDRLYGISLGYIKPINSLGTNASITASHSENNSSRYDPDPVPNSNGINSSLRGALNHLIYTDEKQNLTAEFGTNYKYSKDFTLDVNNSNEDNTKDTYVSADLNLSYSITDKLNAYNNASFTATQGVSGTYKNYTDPTDTTDKHFNWVQLDLTRDQPLSHDFSLFSRICGAHSDSDLPSSEQFAMGGRDFGRGYDSALLVGNKMLAGSLEIRYNKYFDDNQWLQSLQPYIFRDTGYIGKQDSGTNITHLSSYGAGLRINLNYGINIESEVAQPMKKNYNIDDSPYTSTTVYSAMISKNFSF